MQIRCESPRKSSLPAVFLKGGRSRGVIVASAEMSKQERGEARLAASKTYEAYEACEA